MIINFIKEKIEDFKRFQENRYFKSKQNALIQAQKDRIVKQSSLRKSMEKDIASMKKTGKTDETIFSFLVAEYSQKCNNIQSAFRYDKGKVIIF